MKILLPIKFTLQMVWKAARLYFILILIFTTFLALASVVNTITFKEIIDSATGTHTLLGLSVFGVIIVRFIYEILKKTVEGIVTYCWQLLDIKQVIFMHRAFVDKVATMDLASFENPATVGLIQRAFSRLQFQLKLYIQSIVLMLSSSVELLVAVSIFFLASPVLAVLIILANLVPIFVRSQYAYGVFMIYRADDETRRKFGYTANIVTDRETLPEVKVDRAFSFFKEKLSNIYAQFTQKQIKNEKRFQLYNTLAEYVPTLMIFTFSIYIASQLIQAKISTGLFVLLFTNIFTFQGALSRFSQYLGQLNLNGHFIDEIREFFELKPNITFPTVGETQKAKLLKKIKNPKIVFENVSFAYPNSQDKKALENINLTIPYGQNLALIGENGAGKTTLVKLLLRMYDPTEGRILINDMDLKDLPEEVLFTLYSTLFQSFGKFNLTIKENLEMAAGNNLSEEEMIKCLKFSNAWEFVKDTKNKLLQQLGPEYKDGTDLSGGQWQRIAIARAYAKSAAVLILDEPTSAVDAKSEMEIFDRLNKEMKVNTLIFISHRFSTIKDAEKIVVLDQGKIIEEGTHSTLMNNKGKYFNLYTIQAQRYQRD